MAKRVKPPTIVGVKGDDAPAEVAHIRTSGPKTELYGVTSPTISATFTAKNEAEVDKIASKNGIKRVKKAKKPGDERYKINKNEPIRC